MSKRPRHPQNAPDATSRPGPPSPRGGDAVFGTPADEADTELRFDPAITEDGEAELDAADVDAPGGESEAAAAEDRPEHLRLVLRRDVQQRLDKYLQQRIKGASRNQVQKLIDAGGVTVNDRPPKASTVLRVGDKVDVILPPRPVKYLKPEPIPLDILYEDGDFIVVNKQDDLIVHPARSHLSGTLLNALAHHFQQLQGAQAIEPADERGSRNQEAQPKWRDGVRGLSSVGTQELRPGVIHRLDKHTTGVIVVAKSDEAHWQIARQFESRTTLKAYLALVHGCPEEVGGVIDQPIGKHPTIREAMAVRHDHVGKPSVTLYRVRERYRGYSLVELELRTGRTHQIRVHLSYIGYPIVGDILYGGEPIGRRELDDPPTAAGSRKYLNFARPKDEGVLIEQLALKREDLLMTRPALHAALLRLTHPRTQEVMTFTAPMHGPMGALVKALRNRPAEGPTAGEGWHVDLSRAVD